MDPAWGRRDRSLETQTGRRIGTLECLHHSAGDFAGLRDRDRDTVEQAASILWAALPLSTYAPEMRTEPGPSAPGHDEANAGLHVRIEGQSVRAAYELHAVSAQEIDELLFSALETPIRMRCQVAIRVRRHVHKDNTVGFLRRSEGSVDELQVLFARALDSLVSPGCGIFDQILVRPALR